MCLYHYGSKDRNDFLNKHVGKTEITVWKVYVVDEGDVYPEYYSTRKVIKPGWIKSDRNSQFNDEYDDENEEGICGQVVNRGIHVYLTRKTARENCYYPCRVFKCTARLADLVAVGNLYNPDEAVFMKIRLTREEWTKGKKGRN